MNVIVYKTLQVISPWIQWHITQTDCIMLHTACGCLITAMKGTIQFWKKKKLPLSETDSSKFLGIDDDDDDDDDVW